MLKRLVKPSGYDELESKYNFKAIERLSTCFVPVKLSMFTFQLFKSNDSTLVRVSCGADSLYESNVVRYVFIEKLTGVPL